MSDAEQSRFTPENPHWYADLPERDAPDDDRPAIFGDLNHIDETYLEISKASGKLRGGDALFFDSNLSDSAFHSLGFDK